MRKHKSAALAWAVALSIFCLSEVPATGQETTPAVYRLEFRVHRHDEGKRVDTRNLKMLLEDGKKGTVRIGNRVPLPNASGGVQFADVGLNLDSSLRVRGEKVHLYLSLEMSEADAQPGAQGPPMIRQVRTTVSTAITPGKATTVCTMDDAVEDRRYDLEVVAVKEK